ncbi:acetate--CoA ligase family protein [Streptomyces varsoviensis]|uniref:acetate--CoA ligase family protein n=1 Tax=Streptomyces varsoviensis TaxID=67373 RepID=UPI00055EA597|nr:acetate--CoA ligase [Streptomyces varsoviensis]
MTLATTARTGPAAPGRGLDALFAPRAVAVVGASDDQSKYGNWISVQALRMSGERPVHLVNRRGGPVLGRPAYRSLAEVPGPVDLVVIAVPAAGFEAAVEEALAAGARAIVGITAGFGELGADGKAREAALAERVRRAGAVLLGPNCLGVLDSTSGLYLASNPLPAGPVGLISQSGNMALELSAFLTGRGLGFSRFASLGNQADLNAADLVRAYAAHDGTELIAVYCEDFGDGRAFVAAASGAVAAGKPVVLLTVGSSAASVRGAKSHTGALTSDTSVIDAACRAAGVDRVHSPREMADLLAALHRYGPAPARRVAVLADGGGHASVACDVAEACGLSVPEFAPATADALRAGLPPSAGVGNPVDLAGAGEQDIASFTRTLDTLLADPGTDSVLVTGYFGGYGRYGEELAAREIATARDMGASVRRHGRPVVVHTMCADSPAADELRAQGVPVFAAVEDAARTLGMLARRTAAGVDAPRPIGAAAPVDTSQPTPAAPAGEPQPGTDAPRPVPAAATDAPRPAPAAATDAPRPAPAAATDTPRPAPAAPPVTDDGYWSARELIRSAGVAFPPAHLVRTAAEAAAAARAIGGPVVLKALGLLHKSDSGGVALGLRDEDAVRAAHADMARRLDPPGFCVEAMADLGGGVELIVGVRRDARFGPVAMVGLGGVATEVLRDVVFALAPVAPAHARTILGELRAAALLRGVRGRPAVDLDALAAAVATVTEVAAAHPEIAELEVNPLLATADGCLGLDARIVLEH